LKSKLQAKFPEQSSKSGKKLIRKFCTTICGGREGGRELACLLSLQEKLIYLLILEQKRKKDGEIWLHLILKQKGKKRATSHQEVRRSKVPSPHEVTATLPSVQTPC
jgi:hypothetical protein